MGTGLKSVPIVLKEIVSCGPRPSIRHVTDDVGNCSDALMNSRDTITVTLFSSVTLSLVAYVLGLVRLDTLFLLPALEI